MTSTREVIEKVIAKNQKLLDQYLRLGEGILIRKQDEYYEKLRVQCEKYQYAINEMKSLLDSLFPPTKQRILLEAVLTTEKPRHKGGEIVTRGELKKFIPEIHDLTLDELKVEGGYRVPYKEEWDEDYGLGYCNRLRNQGNRELTF